jgi:hypothetical protein
LMIPNTKFASDLSGLGSLGMSATDINAIQSRVANLPGGVLIADRRHIAA